MKRFRMLVPGILCSLALCIVFLARPMSASAQNIPHSRSQAVAASVAPQTCRYIDISGPQPAGPVTLYLWEYTCGPVFHCELIPNKAGYYYLYLLHNGNVIRSATNQGYRDVGYPMNSGGAGGTSGFSCSSSPPNPSPVG